MSDPDYTRACLLHLIDRGGGHGYALARQAEKFGVRGGGPVVYRALRRMEAEGLVCSSIGRSASAGPVRRDYELTPAGRTRMDRLIEQVRRETGALLQSVDANVHA